MAKTSTKPLEFIVASAEQASKHVPEVPTLAIRIFATDITGRGKNMYPPFNPELYCQVYEYTFDDVDMPCEDKQMRKDFEAMNYKLFSRDIAKQIIADFKQSHSYVSSVLVHCFAGVSRSPAVAQSLNKIFAIKYDFKQLFPNTNFYVYKTMIGAAREIGYKIGDKIKN